MTPLTITILSLMCLGIVSCIIAFIYTKFIKPNSFGYSNKNSLIKHEYNQLIKKLRMDTKITTFENLYLLFSEQKKPILIEKMFVTHQNIYFISNPIEKKFTNLEIKNSKIKIEHKNKLFDLPLDVELLLNNIKKLSKYTKEKNIVTIIPMMNIDFEEKEINNLSFVQYDNLYSFIHNKENESTDFDSKLFLELIKSVNIKPKPKKKFFGFIKL